MNHGTRTRARAALLALFASASLMLASCGGDGGTSPSIGPFASGVAAPPATSVKGVGAIKVLSNRADLLSGGNALMEVVPDAGVDPSKLRIEVAGADVTDAFATRENGRFMGLVTGLANGENVLSATLADGSKSSITLTNHPISGPILYGPQLQPWGCDAGAVDASCNRPISYAFKYVSSDPARTGFQPYDLAHPAADVATTTTDQGKAVPFIVRIETGVQDRDYYDIAVLFDPAKPWTTWQPQPAWNRKLLIRHGAGCGTGFSQSNVLSSARVLDTYALSRGFAVLAVALNDAGHNCNIAVEAEATMMAKEHLIETYGELRYTFGFGQSGGSVAQQWLANAYPGLYNGLVLGMSFPDDGSVGLEVEDCALLKNYFRATPTAWSPAQQAAASGHLNTGVCGQWIDVFGFQNSQNPYATNLSTLLPDASITALGGCDAPADARYDAASNPKGVRCGFAEASVSIFGKRPDGFANRPYSNVGVQYGLLALKSRGITPEQFVDLNAGVGSHDIDYHPQAPRVAADAGAIEASYRSGTFNQGNGMGSVAIIDWRVLDVSGIHHQFRAWTMRERLDRANGGHGNQAIWYAAGSQREGYDAMDTWLAAIENDRSSKSLEQKVIANRPAQANDRCGAADGTGLTMLQCTGLADGSTRMGAGGRMTDDVLECQLMPLDRSGYGSIVFTDAQWARLQATFASGVCDYGRPGKGQQPTQFWQRYLDALGRVIVGGQPLPPAP